MYLRNVSSRSERGNTLLPLMTTAGKMDGSVRSMDRRTDTEQVDDQWRVYGH